MKNKTFAITAGTIFLIIAALHLLRSILGWDAVIGSWQVPMWLSWGAVALAGFLAFQAFKLR